MVLHRVSMNTGRHLVSYLLSMGLEILVSTKFLTFPSKVLLLLCDAIICNILWPKNPIMKLPGRPRNSYFLVIWQLKMNHHLTIYSSSDHYFSLLLCSCSMLLLMLDFYAK